MKLGFHNVPQGAQELLKAPARMENHWHGMNVSNNAQLARDARNAVMQGVPQADGVLIVEHIRDLVNIFSSGMCVPGVCFAPIRRATDDHTTSLARNVSGCALADGEVPSVYSQINAGRSGAFQEKPAAR